MLRNTDVNEIDCENTFIDWVYRPAEPSPARSFVENTVQWGTDSTFDNEKAGTLHRVCVKHVTQFQLKLIPVDEVEVQAERDGSGDLEYIPSTVSRSSRAQSPASTVQKRAGRGTRRSPRKSQADKVKAGTAGSSIAPCKPSGARKRLILEQKRSNHIRYEQKRRGLIRDRFHGLTELVQELRGGTWSRSKILLKQ